MNYSICEYVSDQKQTIKFEDNILTRNVQALLALAPAGHPERAGTIPS